MSVFISVLHLAWASTASPRYVLWRPADSPAPLFAPGQRPLLLHWMQAVFLDQEAAPCVSWARPGGGVFIPLSSCSLIGSEISVLEPLGHFGEVS